MGKEDIRAVDLVPALSAKYRSVRFNAALRPLGTLPGLVKADDEYSGSLAYKSLGIEVVLNEGEWLPKIATPEEAKEMFVVAVMFFGTSSQDHAKFVGELPEDLRFGMSASAARTKLGTATKSGGGIESELGFIPPWDLFDRRGYLLHCQYSDEMRLDMITIQLSDRLIGNPLNRH